MRRITATPWVAVLVSGCVAGSTDGGGPAGPDVTIPQPPGELRAWTDTVHDGAVDGFATAGGADLAATWEGASWWLRSNQAPTVISLTEGPVEVAAPTQEGLWVVLDEDLMLFDGVLRTVPWTSVLDGPVRDLKSTPHGLWLQTNDGLTVRHLGRLNELALDGAIPQPYAVGGRLAGQEVLWAGHGSLVVAMDPLTADVVEGHDLGSDVLDVAVDGSGRILALTATEVIERTGAEWRSLPVEQPEALLAHHEADGVWIRTASGWMHHGRDGTNHVLDAEDAVDAWQIDGLGRLLYEQDALMRVAAGRPIEVLGVSRYQRIEAPTFLELVPTNPDGVLQVSAALVRGESRVDLEIGPDGTTSIDPLGLVFGAWTLEVRTTFDDAPDGVTEIPLAMAAAGGATWSEHVQPIYEAHCSNCHDGASETVLDTPEHWEQNIDRVLENVIAQQMPLVGIPLDDTQIALIQAWEAGGFEP